MQGDCGFNPNHPSVPYLARLIASFKCRVVEKNSKTVIVLILFANNAFVIMNEAILF